MCFGAHLRQRLHLCKLLLHLVVVVPAGLHQGAMSMKSKCAQTLDHVSHWCIPRITYVVILNILAEQLE